MFGRFRFWTPKPAPLGGGEWKCHHCGDVHNHLSIKFYTPNGVLCNTCNNSLKDVK